LKAVVLAGGAPGELHPRLGKAHIPLAGIEMARRTLQAVVTAPGIEQVVLVSDVRPDWPEPFEWAPASPDLMGSFESGVRATQVSHEPVLVCCGDLPLVTPESVADVCMRVARRPEASLWYVYLRQENSLYAYPHLRHTWARFADGTYCGTGIMLLRPQVMEAMRSAMERLTFARKNMLRLAGCLGWGNLFNYALGRLTVERAERAGQGIFQVKCAGIETPYAELGFNVDDADSLAEARRILGDEHVT
jgi:molybdopterin-guanine dinucleotide biosynthesis protein A